jgi:hypothetical protein
MDWTLLRCPNAFVTSDRAFAIHDPSPRFPFSHQAIMSSPEVETTIPVSVDMCLLLRPIGRGLHIQELSEHHTESVNLRTYGWADRYVFAPSKEAADAVATLAEDNPDVVVRPRPYYHVQFLDADPDDDSFAEENRQRGWTGRVMHKGELHDYVAIPYGEPDPELQARIDATLEAREQKRQGIRDGSRPAGRIITEIAHPLDTHPAE